MTYVMNGVPTVPGAVIGLVMIGAALARATVILIVALPVPVLFVALITTFETPAAVGVPAMAPVKALRVRPVGSVPEV